MVDGNKDHPFVKLLDKTGFSDHPDVIKFFYDMAQKMGEDELIADEQGVGTLDRENVRMKINEVRADANHPFHNEMDPRHKDAVKEMSRLYDLMDLMGGVKA